MDFFHWRGVKSRCEPCNRAILEQSHGSPLTLLYMELFVFVFNHKLWICRESGWEGGKEGGKEDIAIDTFCTWNYTCHCVQPELCSTINFGFVMSLDGGREGGKILPLTLL